MSNFTLVFWSVIAVTFASGTGAILLVTLGPSRKSIAGRSLADRLAQITLAGAAVLFGLLARFGG